MTDLHPALKAGLKGGQKQHFNRVHHAEIKQHYYEHGALATCERYNLLPSTLRSILHRENYYKQMNKLSEADKWVFHAVMNDNGDLRRRISELEEWRSEVEPVITIGRGIVATLAQTEPQSSKLSPSANALRLDDFGVELKK